MSLIPPELVCEASRSSPFAPLVALIPDRVARVVSFTSHVSPPVALRAPVFLLFTTALSGCGKQTTQTQRWTREGGVNGLAFTCGGAGGLSSEPAFLILHKKDR